MERKAKNREEAPGFHDVETPLRCRDIEHDAPMFLYVPPGKKFVHYCPTCGKKSVVFGDMHA